MDTHSLLEGINQTELIAIAPPIIAWKIGAVDNAESVAQFMYRGGPQSPQASVGIPDRPDVRPEKTYWLAVKTEMHTFLCTDDKKYKELWKRISELDKRSTSTIVALVSAYLGSIIGVAGTVVAGFVAVCLYAVIKLGKEAYCMYARKSAA